MTQTNVPGTDRGPAPAAHRIRVRLLVSDVVMIGLPSLAWAVSASMTSTLRATYTHTVNLVDPLSPDVVLRTTLMDDEEASLRGYLLHQPGHCRAAGRLGRRRQYAPRRRDLLVYRAAGLERSSQ